jgi:23S rRNA pseudouridine955/2504/2580 synthase
MVNPRQRAEIATALVTVEPEQAGRRLDNFLLTALKGVPRSRIYRLLRRGEVRVNSRRCKADYRLQTGDRVRIPPVRTAEEGPAVAPPEPMRLRLAERIVYEDERLLILNKPAGLAVHGGSGLSYGVIEALRAMRPQAPFLELGHRLDRDTSGLLVVAKRRSALGALHELLRSGQVEKRYLALVAGRWRGGPRRVEAALHKNVLAGGERVVRVDAAGKPAVSHFTPITVYDQASLMEIGLDTGRTHQIRVHAAHIGHPLGGDEKYGDAEFNRIMADLGLNRLFLHAHALVFDLPGGPAIDVGIPLEPALARVLDRLS